MGSGLLTLPGLAYNEAGSAAIYAWVISAAVSAPLLVVFATLGGRIPNAGGIAGFVQAALLFNSQPRGTGIAPIADWSLGIPTVGLVFFAFVGWEMWVGASSACLASSSCSATSAAESGRPRGWCSHQRGKGCCLLPTVISTVHQPSGTPRRAVIVTMLAFLPAVALYYADLISHGDLFRLAGVGFFSLYALSVLAYLRLTDNTVAHVFGLATLALVLAVLWTFGVILIFPLVLFGVGWLWQRRASSRH